MSLPSETNPAQAEDWNAAESAAARTAVLNVRIDAARKVAPVYSTWKHKKGGLYQVMGYQIDTDTGRARIRYKRYGGPEYDATAEKGVEFSRPVEEWTEDRFVKTTEGKPPVYR